MDIHELSNYLDEYLGTARIADYPTAMNGLQVQNSGSVSRIAVAVDASEASILEASRRKCDVLIAHHGLFWDGSQPVTGGRYRRFRLLMSHDMAVYASHLPLDVHADVGNNARLCAALAIEVQGTIGMRQGTSIGLWGILRTSRDELAERLGAVLNGPVRLLPGGPERVERVGVITGGAGSMIGDAARAGLHAFITGEGAHHTFFDAMESGINVYYGGHYATETFGVRALGAHLQAKFGLPFEFIDQPTGL
jgi:dinuclear metal center YbgI/SA1388 family protein